MPVAVVCAAFDAATDEAVYEVRDVVRAAGVPLPERPAHRPHLSLAAAAVRANAAVRAHAVRADAVRADALDADSVEQVVAAARGVAELHPAFDMVLNEVGRFGRAGALWLGPSRPSAELLNLQGDADAALINAGWPRAFRKRTEPAQWVAHCTLATRIAEPRLREIQAAVRADYRPIRARIDAVAVILVGGRGDVAHLPLQ